jgi:hypothetical protein
MEIRVINSRDIARCPKYSLHPAHFRDDGTCRCDERETARAEVERLRAELTEARIRLSQT